MTRVHGGGAERVAEEDEVGEVGDDAEAKSAPSDAEAKSAPSAAEAKSAPPEEEPSSRADAEPSPPSAAATRRARARRLRTECTDILARREPPRRPTARRTIDRGGTRSPRVVVGARSRRSPRRGAFAIARRCLRVVSEGAWRAPRRRNRRLRRRGGPPRDSRRRRPPRGRRPWRRPTARIRSSSSAASLLFPVGGSWDGRGLRGGVSPTLTPPRARGLGGRGGRRRGRGTRALVPGGGGGAPGAPIAGGGRRGTGSADARDQRATATRIAPPSRQPTPRSAFGRGGSGRAPGRSRGSLAASRNAVETCATSRASRGRRRRMDTRCSYGRRSIAAGEPGSGAGRGAAGRGAAAGPHAAASAAPGAREDASWSRRRAE